MLRKNIFIYGDSNTCGYVPTLKPYDGCDEHTLRYDLKDIWWYPLTKDNKVFVNGNNGRTINNDHPLYNNKNALKTIDNDFINVDIDLSIIMLGTNDMKEKYHLSTDDIIINIDKLVKKIIKRYQCDILLICPPLILDSSITKINYGNAMYKIRDYELKLKKYALDNGYYFLSSTTCEVGLDGEHLTKQGHNTLGKLVYDKIKEL